MNYYINEYNKKKGGGGVQIKCYLLASYLQLAASIYLFILNQEIIKKKHYTHHISKKCKKNNSTKSILYSPC